MNSDFDDFHVDPELQRLLDSPQSPDYLRLRDSDLYKGFDNNAGLNWIYPTNMPLREYQLNIVQAALFRNTLVVLPTGLGKTFIAAVVMYNIYRWYPNGKVIFMAPTRPLVAQQIDACRRIMPFPQNDTVELTGKLPKPRRAELWQSKRVFFVTPQVLQSDFMDASGNFPLNDIKLLVVDEAHKAKGRYAYVEVTQRVWQHNRNFRVLALSATPGRTVEDVAAVVRNLLISHIEVRCENSIDVMPYVHKRNMKTIVIPMGEQIKRLRQELTDIIDPYLRQLIDANALSHTSLHSINRNVLLYEQKSFRERSSMMDLSGAQQSNVFSNFSICISLYYALELLERHGVRVFLNNFEENEEGRAKFVLNIDRSLRDLVMRVQKEVGPNPFDISTHTMTNGKIATIPENLDFGHPKFEHARQVLLQHFQNNCESRAIVFCEYRESVMLIYRLLMQHTPTLRPRCFVGQGGSTGSLRALTQKQQIEIMNDFRSNKSNVLVATSIGEEGIDVGEVDLIVCFDMSTSNPTRFIQRIGRTGRQKQGNVVMLVTEGREEKILKDVLSQKNQTIRIQHSNVVKGALYQHSPRLVPNELNPKCVQTFIKPPEETENEVTVKGSQQSKLKKGTTKNKYADLRKFFSPTKSDRRNEDDTPNSQLNDEDLKILNNFNKPLEPSDNERLHQMHADKCTSRFKILLKDVNAGGILASNTQLLATQASQANQLKLNSTNASQSTEGSRAVKVSQQPKLKKETTKINNSDLRKFFSPTKRNADSTSQQHDDDLIILDDCSKPADSSSPLNTEKYINHFNNLTGTQSKSSNQNMLNSRQLRKLNAFLHSNTPILSTFQRITNFRDQLKSKKLSIAAKQILLKLRPDYIQEMLETMRVIEALGVSEEKNISPEEREIRSNYELVESLCGGSRSAVEQFLKNIEQKNQKSKIENKIDFITSIDFNNDLELDESDEEEFENCAMNIFKGLEMSGGRCCDNFDYIQEQLKQTQQFNSSKQFIDEKSSTINSKKFGESIVFDTINDGMNTSYDYSHIESKYCSQWDQFDGMELPNKSTPVTKSKLPDEQKNTSTTNEIISLLDDDNDIFEASFERESDITAAIEKEITTDKSTNASEELNTPSKSIFDLDLTAFMEPFSEELQLPMKTAQEVYSLSPNGSTKENLNYSNRRTKEDEKSPDIFQMTIVQPTEKPSLSSKLAAKTLNTFSKAPLTAPLLRTPQKASTPLAVRPNLSVNGQSLGSIQSTVTATTTTSPKQLKSPSVFDMYLRNVRVMREKLPVSPLAANAVVNKSNCDSFIVRQPRTSKRRIFESDSDPEDAPIQQRLPKQDPNITNKKNECQISLSNKQVSKRNSGRQQRKKRRRICQFIDDEAAVSGTDDSENEAECTRDNEMLASLLARSSEEEEDDNVASTSHMQGVYLQSVRSPLKRPNTFKIPAHRVFNDNDFIYSQPPAIEHSQYEHDSFVVTEEDAKCKSTDVSLCPLERAERILKERRRQRRQLAKLPSFKSGKKESCHRLRNVSSDNSSDFESN